MPSNDPAERANAIAYLALCEIRDLEPDAEPEELRQARRHLHARLQPQAEAPPPQAENWRQPFDDFLAAPQDVQDRIVLEAVSGRRRTSVQVNEAIEKQSPHCRCHGSETRKVLDRLVAAGALDREPWADGPCRYRWFRRVPDELDAFEQAFEAAS
ncbi:MAG TPA: hypothetical protein VHZ54_04670 [Solirubrobacterales bacterium]|jgi:hypothetical protein|nr:hypothetical protein [Solirubrobacterales bacterium]